MVSYHNKSITWLVLLVVMLLAAIFISLSVGTVYVPYGGILQNIWANLGLPGNIATPLTPEEEAVFWFVRLPRIIIALLVGAGLAMAGTVMQAVFSNPLADPGIMGVSAGASLGAVIAIGLGLTSLNMFYMPATAFVGALIAVLLTVFLTIKGGKLNPLTLLLAGVAVSMLLGAFTSGILTFMNEYRLREFLFWMVGGLDYRRWEHVYIAVGPILLGLSILCATSRHLNVLILGDVEAKSLGMPVMFYRFFFLVIASCITAISVCVSGSIGFVGLVVPHIMRLLVGPDHRFLIPVTAITGAIFLLICDTIGRTIISPIEIRVGIMTALLGSPYFLYLLRRLRMKGAL